MAYWARVLGCLLEVLYPQRCALCGREPHETCWTPRGCLVTGLRSWDGSHLCRDCDASLQIGLVTGRLGGQGDEPVAVLAAAATNPDLVKLVGQFKYHGVRGIAWPLAAMLAVPLAKAMKRWGPLDALVPVALHRRRRRIRGFNQAEILARLTARGTEVQVRTDILVRNRNTGQQAKITTSKERQRNLAGAFRARPCASWARPGVDNGRRVVLVDDLVTSGCTALGAAQSLRSAGWQVAGVLALGFAYKAENNGPRVDTWEAGF